MPMPSTKNIKAITLLPAAVHVIALQSCSYLLTSTLSGRDDMYAIVNVALMAINQNLA